MFATSVHVILITAFFVQALISVKTGGQTFLIALIALSSSSFVFAAILRGKRAGLDPTVALMAGIMTFSLVTGGLLFKSLAMEAIDEGLNLPLLTYALASFVCVTSAIVGTSRIALILHFRVRSRLVRALGRIPDYYKWPTSFQLYFMGILGLCARLSTGTYAEEGFNHDVPAILRVAEAFQFLMYAPILIIFKGLSCPGAPCARGLHIPLALYLYFSVILLVALAKNYRSVFVDFAMLGVTAWLYGVYIGAYQAKITLQKLLLWPIGVIFLVVAVNRVSLAMVMVREYRTTASPSEMISLTIEALSDSRWASTYEEQREDLDARDDGYSEKYVAGRTISRLVTTKFLDNVLYYGSELDRAAKVELRAFVTMKSIAVLPAPILSWLSVNLDKDDVNKSAGDVVFELAEGRIVNGYKLGSAIGVLYTVSGWVGIAGAVLLFLVLSWLYAGLVGAGSCCFAFGLLMIWRLCGTLGSYNLLGDSPASIFTGATRGIVQSLLAYLIVYWVSVMFYKDRAQHRA